MTPDNSLEPTLRNLALACVADIVLPAEGTPEEPEAQRLRAVMERFGRAAEIADAMSEIRLNPHEDDRRIVGIAEEFHLTGPELLAVALCAGVDDSLWTGRLVAWAQRGLAGSRPVMGLLARAFAVLVADEKLSACTLAEGAAFGAGLLVFTAETEPLAERAVSVPLPVARALAGHEMPWPGRIVMPMDTFALAPSLREQARHFMRLLRAAIPPVLIVRAPSQDDARMAVLELMEDFYDEPWDPVFLGPDAPLSGLELWMRLTRHFPVFVVNPAPGETKMVPWIPYHKGPVLVIAGPDGGVVAGWRDEIEWRLPMPAPEERESLWRRVLPEDDAAELSRTHRQGAARIAQVSRLAKLRAALDERAALTLEDVRSVSRSGEGTGLGALAQLMTGDVADDAFIRTPDLRAQLGSLLSRCRLRDGLADELGPSARARYSPGVRALFTGPSGTGKTLAAGWLATELGLPLYRVDLAAISSKYIGETERNLSQLLAAAEHSAVVLLFDEADSLFGKRTDIRDSTDRFANAQTNYLLQRIETFDGIAVLTSNSRAHFDAAFARRLDAVVEFPTPGHAERRAIWFSHLGDVLEGEELTLLAEHSDLVGGQIRNVVFAAAVEARSRGAKLSLLPVLRAIVAEYRKSGRTAPCQLTQPLE